MKILKAFGPQDLRIAEVPIPEPGPGQVLIKVRTSGICGSDKWLWNVTGETDAIAGHEVAGDVCKLGGGVYSLSEGDRVAVNNVGGCGTCLACRGGKFVKCPNWDGSGDVNNGFGEYLVAPAINCMKIHPGLDYIEGALIIDNWGTPYGGIVRANVKQGMDVIVNGCGPIGQAATALCTAAGAYVVAVDPIEYRRQFALKNGAKTALHPNELPHAAKNLTDGLGAHVLLECSGTGEAYDNCLKSLRIGGTLVSIGEHAQINLNVSEQIIRRSLTIAGTWYSTMPQSVEIMHMAVCGKINLKCFLTHVVSLEEAAKLFGSVISCDDGFMKVVIAF